MIKYLSKIAGIAQSVEQLIRNQQVAGSSPVTSSKNAPSRYLDGAFCIIILPSGVNAEVPDQKFVPESVRHGEAENHWDDWSVLHYEGYQ